jgi:hypothetical protein
MQNGHIESFNSRLHDECLNANWFRTLFEARHKIAYCGMTTRLCAHTAAWRTEHATEP